MSVMFNLDIWKSYIKHYVYAKNKHYKTLERLIGETTTTNDNKYLHELLRPYRVLFPVPVLLIFLEDINSVTKPPPPKKKKKNK